MGLEDRQQLIGSIKPPEYLPILYDSCINPAIVTLWKIQLATDTSTPKNAGSIFFELAQDEQISINAFRFSFLWQMENNDASFRKVGHDRVGLRPRWGWIGLFCS
jgi:hypothetical protein